jgi:hypothetical protein
VVQQVLFIYKKQQNAQTAMQQSGFFGHLAIKDITLIIKYIMHIIYVMGANTVGIKMGP